MLTTTRLGLEYPQTNDNESAYPAVSAQQMGVLDAAMVITEGVLVSRPAASGVAYGSIYYATDSAEYYLSNGTVWQSLILGGTGLTGASNIATSQSTSSTSYTTLGTPDQVTGLVLPTNGLVRVWYQATWQESVAGAARAAIFLGSNQLKVAELGYATGTEAAATSQSSNTNENYPLTTCPIGLVCCSAGGGTYAGDVTTGQAVGFWTPSLVGAEIAGNVETIFGSTPPIGGSVLGGPCDIFAAAGTYTVSVQFKASSGSVTASNRKLWVQVIPFS